MLYMLFLQGTEEKYGDLPSDEIVYIWTTHSKVGRGKTRDGIVEIPGQRSQG